MTIAIDMVGTNLRSGTRTYNINFCEYLSHKNLKNKIYIFITYNYYNELKKNNPNIIYVLKPNYFSNIIYRFFWMQFILPFELRRLDIKKLYSPMNFSPLILRILNIRLILGLHSNLPWVLFKKMPGSFFRKKFTKFMMEKSIKASDTLITCSNFAKEEIIKCLKIKKKNILPIYLGVEHKFLKKKKNNYYLKKFDYNNYIISVLSCARYHNIINLLKAFKLLKKKNFETLKLVFILQVLDQRYFLEIKEFIKLNFNKDEIKIYHNLDSKYLINIYRKAKFYIFSSYCEVFGLTSLEAMSQKCPVLISNKSALPEINKDAALYFNPDNIIQIKDLMHKLLTNSKLRKMLVNRGDIHSKKFTWKKTLEKTISILDV
ncbi:glycosyltransferase [Candidatus Pelagibacter ubique]|jgi:glycosyltransferase involved in cell wall biosynthesis|nr:glycosyltransferase [Candidatus Pelagibacter ubique]